MSPIGKKLVIDVIHAKKRQVIDAVHTEKEVTQFGHVKKWQVTDVGRAGTEVGH